MDPSNPSSPQPPPSQVPQPQRTYPSPDELPHPRDLFAVLADRAVQRESNSMLTWGLICSALGIVGMIQSLFSIVVLALGVGMAAAGLVFKSQKSLGAFIASGATLLLVGFLNIGFQALEWLVDEPKSKGIGFWGILGVFQIFWAFGAFKRGQIFRKILGGWGTDSTPQAQAVVNWLRAMPLGAPGVIVLRLGSPSGQAWKAVLGNGFLFAIDLTATSGMVLPMDAVEKAMAGEPVAAPGSSRRVFIAPDQVQKLRQMLWDKATAT